MLINNKKSNIIVLNNSMSFRLISDPEGFAIEQLSSYTGLPNGYEFKTSNKDKIVRDFDDAYEKGGPGGDRAGDNRRTYTEWVTDYKRRSSGKRQDDGIAILDYWKDNPTTAQFFWNTGYYANA